MILYISIIRYLILKIPMINTSDILKYFYFFEIILLLIDHK